MTPHTDGSGQAGGPRPRLRSLDVRWMRRDDGRTAVLRDPFGLGGNALAVPAPVTAILSLLDGTRDRQAVLRDAANAFGLTLDAAQLEAVLATLEDAYFLEGPRAEAALAQRLEAYRRAPQRPPAHAGAAYPADASALLGSLAATRRRAGRLRRGDPTVGSTNQSPRSFGAPAAPEAPAVPRQGTGGCAGILSPHIDFERGGPVYAAVWDSVRGAVRGAKRVVILGTDHMGRPGTVTLTRQHYATPLGVLDTDAHAVDALADAIGVEAAFADELHHAAEHSVELALVWLQEALAGRRVGLLPILCGPLPDREADRGVNEAPRAFGAAAGALADLAADGSTFVVVAGDLAHVGPAFGDPDPLDDAARGALAAADEGVLAHLASGAAEDVADAMGGEGAARRYCGAAPLYIALTALAPVRGRLRGYDQCPADEAGGSVVSVAGMVFTPHR